MQADDVALRQQLMQARGRLGVAVAKLVGVIVEDHPHAQRFREVGELRADIAVADDAERLAPHLVAVVGRLVPTPLMGGVGARHDPAQQHDDLADHQFCHAARVGERRVEHRNPAPARGVEVHLVGADAETSDRDQPVRGVENIRGDLRARADAEQMHALDGLPERIALERLGQARHVGIAGSLDQLHGAVVDAFEEQDPDLVLCRARVGEAGWPRSRRPSDS